MGNKSHLRATTFQTALPKVHYGTSDLIHEVIGEQRDPKVGINHMNAAVPFSKDVHPSHHKLLLRNILFCKICGYWSSKKTQKLSTQCCLEPPHSDGRAKLKRMMDGYHPDYRAAQWSDGMSTAIKHKVTCLEG